MTTTTGTNPLAGTSGTLPNAASAASSLGKTTSAADQSANFLKMLVAQMQNQDPLNPMDSAQVTSQMAQISTVQGVETLNTTMTGLNSQFTQMQNQDPLNPMDSAQVTSQMAQISTVQGVQTLNTTMQGLGAQFTQMQTLQGAALVGKDVATEGNAVRVNPATGKGDGGFEIATPATSVKVDIVNEAGQTIDTIDMGAQDAGRHSFSFDVPEADQGQALTFKVTAVNKDTAVDSLPLSYNTVNAVSTLNGSMAIELDNGQNVAYDAIWAFL